MKSRRVVDLLADGLPPVPCWIDPFCLPKRGIMLLAGEAKVAKSFFLLEIARALATGTQLFGNPFFRVTEQCRVLMVEQELGPWGFGQRVKKIFARHNPSAYANTFNYLSKEPDWRFDTPKGRDHIRETIIDYRPNIVILDPISYFYSVDDTNASNVGDLFRQIEHMKQMGLTDEMAVLVSHHMKKPPVGKNNRDGYDPLDPYNIRGSEKWFSAPDTIVTCNRLKGGTKDRWYVDTRWKTRHGEEPPDVQFLVTPDDLTSQVTFEKFLTAPPASSMQVAQTTPARLKL